MFTTQQRARKPGAALAGESIWRTAGSSASSDATISNKHDSADSAAVFAKRGRRLFGASLGRDRFAF